MKSLNKKLWTNLSAKELQETSLQAACCLNAVVNAPTKK